MRVRRFVLASLVLVAMLATAGARRASAQVLGAPVTISLAATQPGALTVTVQSGGVQTIPSLLPNAINNFPSSVQVYTQWNVRPNTGNALSLVAYFSVPAQALTTGAANIPSSRVEARMTTGAVPTFTPITGNGVGTRRHRRWKPCPLDRQLLRLQQRASVPPNSRTDQLDLRLNLIGAALSTGTYSGTLTLRAVLY